MVNEAADLRVLTKRVNDQASVMSNGSRRHEGGFRFVVGRAGIVTNEGRIPLGSTFQEGAMFMEDSSVKGGEWEIDFHCHGPAVLNGFATAVVYHALCNPVLGHG